MLVYRLSGSTFLTALVTALEAAPYLLTGLFAGALADRWNRRRVMVSADLVNAVLDRLDPGRASARRTDRRAGARGRRSPCRAVYTFFDGANFGALPVLVGRARVAQANSAVWTASSLIELFVPPLAGLLLAVLNPATLLTLDALSFVASAIAVRGIVRAMSEQREGQPPLRPRVVLRGHRGGASVPGPASGCPDDDDRGQPAVLRRRRIRRADGGLVRPGAARRYVGTAVRAGLGRVGDRRADRRGRAAAAAEAAAAGRDHALRAAGARRCSGSLTPLSPNWSLAALALLVWGSAYVLVIVNAISYRQQVTPEQLLGRVNTAGRMLSWGVGWTFGSVARRRARQAVRHPDRHGR